MCIGKPQTNLKIWSHYTGIQEHTVFGSYDRETILPRKYEESSDVDYMKIFYNPNNYQPETYRIWIKRFAESEILAKAFGRKTLLKTLDCPN